MTKDDVLDRASWRWLKDRVVTLEREREARDERIRELERQVTNLTSTVEAWNHAEIIKCGCKYNKVWGGMKWEHWLSPCKEHREREQQLKAAQERLAEAEGLLRDVLETTPVDENGHQWGMRAVKEYFAKHSNRG